MAVTWDVRINVDDLETKRITVVGTRADSETSESKSYMLRTQHAEGENLNQLKLRLKTELRAKANADDSLAASVAAFLATAETDIADALDAEEA